MPHQSSPPRQDGRANLSSSSFFSSNSQYTDEDIAVIHAIVTSAEELLPTLPERERLATNALFLAAEIVLPQYGIDPEDVPSHISRLLFKIGGQRSGETLADKLTAVLEGMGIRLEIVSDESLSNTTSLVVDDHSHNTGIGSGPHRLRRHSSAEQPTVSTVTDEPTRGIPVRFSNRARRSSDTTVPTPVDHPHSLRDQERRAAEIQALEEKLELLKQRNTQELLREVVETWRQETFDSKQRRLEAEAVATKYDNDDLLGEVLEIWNQEALDAKQLRLEAEAVAKHAAYVARMERRATRAYEIFTARNVLSHWKDRAKEEVERTAVARRHIVRKRAFGRWHIQHVEDEAKVQNFILSNTLKKWGQATLHNQVRHQVAANWAEQNLSADALTAMLVKTKEGIADDFYLSGLAEECLDTWAARARENQENHHLASVIDERLCLDEAVNVWHEETIEHQYDAYVRTQLFLIQGCQRTLTDWQEQAKLSKVLKQYRAKQEEDAKNSVFQTWLTALHEARRNTALADAFMVKEPAEHWERETKLKLFVRRDEAQTKQAVMDHWALEEKLAWYRRHDENRTKKQVLASFFSAAKQTRSQRLRCEQEADLVSGYYCKIGVMDTWLEETERMAIQTQNANLVCLYRTTTPCLTHWRLSTQEKASQDAYLRRKADQHRDRALVLSVLDDWPTIAETTRRAKMMSKLRKFRYEYKVELAQTCLSKWLSATADAISDGNEAYNIAVHYKREDINDCLDYWKDTANRAQEIRQIAADAELEVYCGKWQSRLLEEQENMQDAIDYDAEKTRAACMEKWEFQTLQQESRRNMAATVQEKNDRRMCSSLLSEWQRKAVPEAAAARIDPRLNSTISRRSIRQQLALQSSIAGGGGPTASQLFNLPTDNSVRFSTATTAATGRSSVQLGPMAEFDEESFHPDAESNDPGFMSTPTKWTGSARPLGYRPSSTTTPSAVLPSPYERELRARYSIRGASRLGGTFADIMEDSAEDGYR
ncbi:Sfi1-domain-containing protein [Canariomyces notabilis]|uniref:Sfi1-domain-containing protein n=1 Tax=Canariomyces notabilis TaxID=2074819 RepID=A0AAN6QCA8_9PEZI|nr:Sfi1-domain-containing protein [Canariomyces arenarius]